VSSHIEPVAVTGLWVLHRSPGGDPLVPARAAVGRRERQSPTTAAPPDGRRPDH
jgi:hypothetical protein